MLPLQLESEAGVDSRAKGLQIVMDLVLVQGSFTPAVVAQISTRLGVPRNFMFMVCPNERFPYDLGDFGGIRIITH